MRRFLLCYHDFSAENADTAESHIQKIAAAANSPLSVAVIPQTERLAPSEVEAFRGRLNSLKFCGHEILLHGARHLDDGGFRRSLWGRTALKLTGGEAEFAGLLKADSETLLQKAQDFWGKLQLDLPAAFVPPAWYGNRYLKNQALSRFTFYEDRIRIFSRNRSRLSPALSFAGLPSATLGTVFAFAKFALKHSPGIPRLVFHPVDFTLLGEEKILELVKFATTLRESVPYERVFETG